MQHQLYFIVLKGQSQSVTNPTKKKKNHPGQIINIKSTKPKLNMQDSQELTPCSRVLLMQKLRSPLLRTQS